MQNIIETFEFKKIEESIASFSKTERGKSFALNIEPYDKKRLPYELESIKEMILIINRYGLLPIEFSENALPLIEHAKKGGILSIKDLDMIGEDVLTSFAVLKYIKKVDESYKNIHQETSGFKDLTSLEKEIHRVITKSQTIDDRATPELLAIRKKIQKVEKELQSEIMSLAIKYKDYLNEETVTIRNGHFVIPVKTVYKNRVHGIIHDISDTGNTTFIEPSNLVELNNDLVSLKSEELDEIRKILKALTNLVLLQEEEIINNNKIIAYLDFLSAKALYANETNSIVGDLSPKQEIYLKDARHPLIDKRFVIANSFELNEEKRIIIISGPNAGGKTVALKTVGLLIYMNQCALALPVIDAKLGYFDHIYIDIGDSQSLSDNLSTFSAHISHIAEITNRVTKNDLVLIDELGTGTDPQEGEAIALAVVNKLEKVRCIALISSHFGTLKEYAFTSSCISNASMLFDEHHLRPTYIFKQGVPGKSYALNVASRFGLDESIIVNAQEHLTKSQSTDINLLMEKIHETALDNENTKKELALEKEKLLKERKMFENDVNLLKEKREKLLQSVENEKQAIIDNTKESIDEVLKALNNPNIKVHEVIELKKKIEDLERHPEVVDYNETISEGSYVSVPSLNIVGRVKRINGKFANINSDSGMSFKIEISKLHLIDEPVRKKVAKTNVDSSISNGLGLEVNVIGYHVEEALDEVSKYLDACQLKNFKQVRIIHGLGSGALRKAIHEYLKKCRFVESYRLGNEYEGGGGATVVVFK
ncbi:MAG: Smr/MutS family protein [Erysipelotrichaceae bacterium]|nr:Smr/MutS family protein [Erysipelotrichaceae bacterium]